MANFFSKNLKFMREKKGLSQTKLAEKIGVNQTTIARWEDDNRVPTIDNAIDVANALNISLPDLLEKNLMLNNGNSKNIDEYIGNKIKYYREKKKISQKELGEFLNTTSQTISRYESGKRGANRDILFLLAEYFNININDFFPSVNTTHDNEIKELQTNTGIKISYPPNKKLTQEDYLAINQLVLNEMKAQEEKK